jgi:GT2 family glycosyltransferase
VSSSTVYIIIANWNGKEVLKQCLQSLFTNTFQPQFQVVVVDNGSTDNSLQMLQKEFPTAKIIKNEINLGFSKANNQGIKYAMQQGAKYFLLLNNDIEVTSKGWLNSMLSVLESEGAIGMVGCKLLYPDGRIQHAGGKIDVSGARHRGDGEKDTGQYDKLEFVDYVTGAALLTKIEVVRRVGLLDEGFSPLYCEDTDWCMRARFCSYKIAYTPKPTLIHKQGSSASTLKQGKNELYFKRSWIRFFLLNFKFKDVLKRLLFYESMEVLACFIDRNPKGRLPLKIRLVLPKLILLSEAWKPNLKNLKEILTKRKQRFKCQSRLSGL